MSGILDYLIFWLLYFTFAAIGFRCWKSMFWKMKPGSDWRRFVYMLGAVLVFTPAPIQAGSEYFAPAFVVFPFTALTVSFSESVYALTWWLGALCVGTVALALYQALRRVRGSGELQETDAELNASNKEGTQQRVG